MAKGLFIVDFDGTLLRDDKTLAAIDLEALAMLRREGFLTAIATGRSFYSFQKIVAELRGGQSERTLPVDYVVFSTGAGIMSFPAAGIIKKYSLPAEDVIAVSTVLDDFGLDYMIHRPVPDTEHFIYRAGSDPNSDFHNRLTLYQEFASPLTPERLACFGEATQLLCIVTKEKGERISTRLSDMFHRQSVIKATSPLDNQSIWIEIFAAGVSKSSAVRWLSRKVGVPRSRIGAVGNDYNDEDLLNWAGEGYMVANGPPSLHSPYTVVASNNQGGVAAAACRWLRMKILQVF